MFVKGTCNDHRNTYFCEIYWRVTGDESCMHGYLLRCKLVMIVGKWSSLELMCSGRGSVLPILCGVVWWGEGGAEREAQI